jgi:hypothetical protein
VCARDADEPFVSMRDQPVHCNVLWDDPDRARSAPRGDLELAFCRGCGHIFNRDFDSSLTAYGGTYENSLHHSPQFQSYAAGLVDELVERHDLHDVDILEIGAGQGDFLEMLCSRGGNRGVAIDPGARTESEHITVVREFVDSRMERHPADAVVCRHVLEHVAEPGEFLSDVARVAGDRLRLMLFEVPNASWVFEDGGVWDVIYEHCGYYAAPSLRAVFELAGFAVDRVESSFGGQYLSVEARPASGVTWCPGRADIDRLESRVNDFATSHADVVSDWTGRLGALRADGRSAAIWGAGSKGVTFVNTVDRAGAVRVAVDVNPQKQGKFVAGTGQPIVAPEHLVDDPPDVVLVMNPNYRSEIEARLRNLDLTPEVNSV